MIATIRLINKPITPYSYLCAFLFFCCFYGENSWKLFLVLLPAATTYSHNTVLRPSNLSICLVWLKGCSPWLLSLFPPSPFSALCEAECFKFHTSMRPYSMRFHVDLLNAWFHVVTNCDSF